VWAAVDVPSTPGLWFTANIPAVEQAQFSRLLAGCHSPKTAVGQWQAIRGCHRFNMYWWAVLLHHQSCTGIL
jgi:hypothetical protein